MADPTPATERPEAPEYTGTPGVPIYGGWLADERDPKLYGQRLFRTYRQMRETHHLIGRAVTLYAETIASVVWRAVPAGADGEEPTPEAVAAAELLHKAWSALPTADIVEDLVDAAATFGVGLQEVAYTTDDAGDWVWAPWEIRRTDTIDQWFTSRPDGGGEWLGVLQRTTTTQAMIGAERLVRVQAQSGQGSPTGRSPLRALYEAWSGQRGMIRIASIGLERSLAGLPFCTVPVSVFNDATKMEPYKQLVSRIKINEAAGIVFPAKLDNAGNPTGFDLSLLSIAGNKGDSPLPLIQFWESCIAIGLLVQFLLLGAGGSGGTVGSFSLADAQTSQLARSLGRFLKRIADALNVEGDRLQALNGIAPEDRAKLVPGDFESVKLAELGAYLDVLSKIGVPLTDTNTAEHLRSLGGLPKADATDAKL